MTPWLADYLTWCRVLTLVLLAAMFTVLGVRAVRRTLDVSKLEGRFSVMSRAVAGVAFALNAGRTLARPAAVSEAVAASESHILTVLGPSLVALAVFWMVLASLPLQRWLQTRSESTDTA